MANMVFTSDGLLKVLANALWDVTHIYEEDWWIELFKSNTTVAYASVLADFTLADFTGYSHYSWTRGSFIGVGVTSGDRVVTQGTTFPTFTCSGGSPQTVYGWLAVGKTSGEVWFGQNFASPRVMTSGAVETLNPFNVYCQTLH
jgi:hypothetical protein